MPQIHEPHSGHTSLVLTRPLSADALKSTRLKPRQAEALLGYNHPHRERAAGQALAIPAVAGVDQLRLLSDLVAYLPALRRLFSMGSNADLWLLPESEISVVNYTFAMALSKLMMLRICGLATVFLRNTVGAFAAFILVGFLSSADSAATPIERGSYLVKQSVPVVQGLPQLRGSRN
jgi:hypothetical protein